MVNVRNAVLDMKSKLNYACHQVRFAALRGHSRMIDLEKEYLPLTKGVGHEWATELN